MSGVLPAVVPTVAASITATVSAVAASADASGSGAFMTLVASTVPNMIASALPSAITTQTPPESVALQMPAWLDLSSAFIGGIVGGLTAVEHKMDFVGVGTLAVVGGLGGGILRDVLLQNRGIWALSSSAPVLTCVTGAVIAASFYSAATRLRMPLVFLGALSFGLFAVAGTDKGILSGLTIVPVILLGTLTATGGAVLQSVLLNEVPGVLRPGTLFAAAAVLGTTTYALMVEWLGVVKPLAVIACITMIVVIRLLAVWLGWESPMPVDYTSKVAAFPRMMLPRRRKKGDPAD